MSNLESNSAFSIPDLILVEELSDQFESELRQGRLGLIPCYLDRCSLQSSTMRRRLAESLLLAEWDYRNEQADPPILSEYLSRNLMPPAAVKRLYDAWNTTNRSANSFGDYRLLERLGEGRFGVVWKAVSLKTQCVVALKIVHPGIVGERDSILREARVAEQLKHPGIARIIATGEFQERPFIAREYIKGETLFEYATRVDIGHEKAAEIILDLAQALAYSHLMSCVHRDVKPQNILIQEDGRLRLIDFGLGKLAASTTSVATRPGTLMGTAAYMSPEQARGDSHLADARSDLYSVGVILFELLTGQRPYEGDFHKTLINVIEKQPVNPRRLNSSIPYELSKICHKCLRNDPSDRYQAAEHLCDDLKRYLAGEKVSAAPEGQWRRLRRFVKGSPIVSALTACLFLLTTLFAIQAVVSEQRMRNLLNQETELRRTADKSRHVSERLTDRIKVESELSNQTTAFLESIFTRLDPLEAYLYGFPSSEQDNSPTIAILKTATERLEGDLSGKPRLKARLLDIVAGVNCSLERLDLASSQLADAARLREGLAKTSPQIDFRLDQAIHNFSQGRHFQLKGEYRSAEKCLAESLELYESILPANDPKIPQALLQTGWLYLEMREPSKAIKCFERALEIYESDLPAGHRLIGTAKLAMMLCDRKTPDAWLEFARDYVPPPSIQSSPLVSYALLSVQAANENSMQNFERAIELHEKIVDGLDRQGLSNTRWFLLATGDYASTLFKIGNYKKAFLIIDPAIRVGRKIAPGHPHVLDASRKLAFEMYLAKRYHESAELFDFAMDHESRTEYSSARYTMPFIHLLIETNQLEKAEFNFDRLDYSNITKVDQVYMQFLKGEIFKAKGEFGQAESAFEESADMASEVTYGYVHPVDLRRFAQSFLEVGRESEAETVLRLALEKVSSQRPRAHPRIADALFDLAQLLVRTDRENEAIQLLKDALIIRMKQLPESDARIKETIDLLKRASIRKRGPQ